MMLLVVVIVILILVFVYFRRENFGSDAYPPQSTNTYQTCLNKPPKGIQMDAPDFCDMCSQQYCGGFSPDEDDYSQFGSWGDGDGRTARISAATKDCNLCRGCSWTQDDWVNNPWQHYDNACT